MCLLGIISESLWDGCITAILHVGKRWIEQLEKPKKKDKLAVSKGKHQQFCILYLMIGTVGF